MLGTPISSIALILGASVLGAFGPFLFHAAAQRSSAGPLLTLLDVRALLGMACYVTIMVLFTAAFKLGGSVRVLYPVYAFTFIWAALLASLIGSDPSPVRAIHVLGMLCLVSGIAMMSW